VQSLLLLLLLRHCPGSCTLSVIPALLMLSHTVWMWTPSGIPSRFYPLHLVWYQALAPVLLLLHLVSWCVADGLVSMCISGPLPERMMLLGSLKWLD